MSGLNAGSSGGNAPVGPVNGAVDGVLNMALQLPAMQKLGQSIGVNLDLGDLDGTSEGTGASQAERLSVHKESDADSNGV